MWIEYTRIMIVPAMLRCQNIFGTTTFFSFSEANHCTIKRKKKINCPKNPIKSHTSSRGESDVNEVSILRIDSVPYIVPLFVRGYVQVDAQQKVYHYAKAEKKQPRNKKRKRYNHPNVACKMHAEREVVVDSP